MLFRSGAVTLRNVTLAFNSVAENGGGIWSNGAGEVSVTTSILAGNTSNGSPRNCETAGTATITSGGGNLSDDATCTTFSAATDKPITPAGLEAELADNGGPTFTHAVQAGSAAIDAGVQAGCPATDQRGYGRSGPCDMGAFEFDGTPPAASARRPGRGRRRVRRARDRPAAAATSPPRAR